MKVSIKFDNDIGFISDDGKDDVKIKNSIVGKEIYHSPTELLLMAMGACTSDDVLVILNKMKMDIKSYRCEIEGEKRDEHPRFLKYAKIHYIFEGDVDPESAAKAIKLSMTKYCSVSLTVKNAGINVSYYFTINGKDYEVN
ncbi:OsmC family protein [Acidiplasma sp.]|uniref:OsmC family protein n=1 Tax=Acidiplasma sp. TaxID=1872114 RepID=UPI00316A6335